MAIRYRESYQSNRRYYSGGGCGWALQIPPRKCYPTASYTPPPQSARTEICSACAGRAIGSTLTGAI